MHFVLFVLLMAQGKKKRSSSLAYQNTVTFLLPQENFQSQTSAATETKFHNCKTLSLKPDFDFYSLLYLTQTKTHMQTLTKICY